MKNLSDPEVEVHAAAAHILVMLNDVQERLDAIRKTAEKLVTKQEAEPDAPDT